LSDCDTVAVGLAEEERRNIMNRRTALLGIAAGSAAATVTTAQSQSGAQGGGSLSAQLLNTAGMIIGTLTIRRFAAINNQLHAIAVISATDGSKTAIGTMALPVTATSDVTVQQQASCPILHLAIGPINLNLLGLVVTTLPIVIDIVAVPGPGNLLGNLLCAIAGLLDPGGALTNVLNQLVGLLNQLLGLLG
jgi:hypothetical protein